MATSASGAPWPPSSTPPPPPPLPLPPHPPPPPPSSPLPFGGGGGAPGDPSVCGAAAWMAQAVAGSCTTRERRCSRASLLPPTYRSNLLRGSTTHDAVAGTILSPRPDLDCCLHYKVQNWIYGPLSQWFFYDQRRGRPTSATRAPATESTPTPTPSPHAKQATEREKILTLRFLKMDKLEVLYRPFVKLVSI
ncbi:hypothetical protein BDA96_05G106400 [Sorghum bicolor]|uniref:Uncharacterized protein n=1 Tax=Sorghum bicolor TaxID=4558 RepID=A0A921QZ64_SORBI|nr:hypothetical protein BDA96_05G106400 [Sorghum bicolor]